MQKKAVVLFSGGLDSTTVLYLAKDQGFDPYPISFDYGQRHLAELQAAKRIAAVLAVKQHKIATIPPDLFGPSALTALSIDVPQHAADQAELIPVTYVPARNTIFLATALGYAETIGAADLFLGVSNIDYSGYPDCRPEYIQAFETMANLATKAAVSGERFTIHAPLLHRTKGETITMGQQLGVDYALTVSCYAATTASGLACGTCDSCTYRKKGFADANLPDPTRYY